MKRSRTEYSIYLAIIAVIALGASALGCVTDAELPSGQRSTGFCDLGANECGSGPRVTAALDLVSSMHLDETVELPRLWLATKAARDLDERLRLASSGFDDVTGDATSSLSGQCNSNPDCTACCYWGPNKWGCTLACQ